jgi:CheY-like chemotaxis protein
MMINNIRNSSPAHNIRIVPFISIAANPTQAELENLNINKFLVKPLKLTELYHVLTQDLTAQDASNPSQNLIASSNGNSHKFNIMVVEDNAINTMVIIDILKHMGFNTTAVSNGADAIEKCGEESFDLIFMDIHMPGMDGFEITRKIRASESADRHIPIIALSADTRKDEIEKSFKEGINHYICKPFSILDIADAINKFLPASISIKTPQKQPQVEINEDVTVFDKETFMIMINHNHETYKKLINMARNEIPMIQEKLNASLQKAYYPDIILYSHELKGISSNLRAMKILAVTKDIEEKSKNAAPLSEMKPLAQMLPALFSEFIVLAEKQNPSQQ